MQKLEKPPSEHLSTVTSKGQITLPLAIRRLLGVRPRDKVAFVVEDDQVRVTRTGSVVARTAGAVKVDRPALTARQEREEFERGLAEEVLKRMRG
jgi:AbrB family looped-hinge helix DNA binding protein